MMPSEKSPAGYLLGSSEAGNDRIELFFFRCQGLFVMRCSFLLFSALQYIWQGHLELRVYQKHNLRESG